MDNLPVNNPLFALIMALLALVVLICWPLALIWSVNTLFQTQIPMDFRTWLATVILVSIFRLCMTSSEKL